MEPPRPSPLSLNPASPHIPNSTDAIEQAGRSPLALHAQKSSASLAYAEARSRPASLINSRSPSIASIRTQKATAPFIARSPAAKSSSDSLSDRTESPVEAVGPSGRAVSALDTIGPANGTASGPLHSKLCDDGLATDYATGRTAISAATAAAIAEAAGLPAPTRPKLHGSTVASRLSSQSLRRDAAPQSVRELGSDYTRYFNPFASHNDPSTVLATPLNGYLRPASALLAPATSTAERRLSNPFDDRKQLSAVPSQMSMREEAHAPEMQEKAGSKSPAMLYRGLSLEKSFFPYLDDRLGAPAAEAAGYTFPLLWDEVEDDDDMHLPRVDDDIKMKPTMRDRFRLENLGNTLGMTFMFLGVMILFVALPVIGFAGISIIDYSYDTPLDEFPNTGAGAPWAHINDVKYPLLKNTRVGLIDPDTPSSAMTKKSKWDGETLNLVFSDEFNDQNRTFYPGDDAYFYAFDGWYGATEDLEWYDPDAVTTYDGTLQIRMDAFESHNLAYRSGMLHSWNQLCYKGGILEVSVSLPGPAGVHGLWPGVWSMGNLGRPGYEATTDGLWPYTYNSCDSGITPNQSMTDGTSKLPGQRLNVCTCPGADHPTPGTGRGAPEIDVLEAADDYGGHGWATATSSYQVAPFDIWYYPNYEYFMTPNYSTSFVNTYTGGPYQQAVSTTSVLNNAWFNGAEYQTYAYDYMPGTGKDSWIAWLVADEIMAGFDGRAIGANGNIKERIISEEPMSIIMNLAISESWTYITWDELTFPTVMYIDYVRVYQREGQESVTCDPLGYETTDYIANHPAAYTDMNYTKWEDAGYSWTTNSYMGQC